MYLPDLPASRRQFLAGVSALGAAGVGQTSLGAVGDAVVRPFRATIAANALAEMRSRIAATRLPDTEPARDDSQGVRIARMTSLLRYWGEGL